MKKEINLKPLFAAYDKANGVRGNADFIAAAEKVTAEIKAVEGKATVRLVDAADIVRYLRKVEAELDIAKKWMEGVKVSIDPNAQNFPNAYKYEPMSTQFDAEFRKGHWVLTDVYRADCRRYGHRNRVILTEDAKREILKRYEAF